ncbi:MAG: ABC transporter ATP-binding protein [Candidatus Binatia bacterium]|nr:MAG: ABC transporter ATP-binding protein [Candidatus Binatia bacterium]
MSGPLLQVEGLTKVFRNPWTFRTFRAVSDLSFTLREGEIFGLIGHNGAGKTTTFKLLLGLLRPTRGRALFCDVPSASLEARRQIGFLPEHPYFYEYLSVAETLDFYARLCGLRGRERQSRVAELLRELRLEPKRDAPLRSLSKGTLQRVGIAQAIVHRPRLVILDEPMSGLDPGGRRAVRELVRGWKEEGTTVVFSSHILPDAETLCDRVGILAYGKLREVVDLRGWARESTAAFRLQARTASLPPELERFVLNGFDRSTGTYTLHVPREALATVVSVLERQGGEIESVLPIRPSLEERFLAYVRPEELTD